VGSCRRDLLEHVIILNERHLKRLLSSCLLYYHEDRTHLGLAKDTPAGRVTEIRSAGKQDSILFETGRACAIAMRWQRRLQGDSSEDKTLLAVTRQRRSSRFLRASFLDPQLAYDLKPMSFRQAERSPFYVGQNDLAIHRSQVNCRAPCRSQAARQIYFTERSLTGKQDRPH